MIISIESGDDMWAGVAAHFCAEFRGVKRFSRGAVFTTEGPLASDTRMDGILVFEQSILDPKVEAFDVNDYRIHFSQFYPIYSAELDVYRRLGLEVFWKHVNLAKYDPKRPPIQGVLAAVSSLCIGQERLAVMHGVRERPKDILDSGWILASGRESRQFVSDARNYKLVPLEMMIGSDATLAPFARLEIPPEYEERAVYIAEGRIEIGGDSFEEGRMLVFRAGDPVTVTAGGPARVLLLGGAPLDGPRHLWWNFVSSSTERIEQAKADWREGRFPQVPGETEFTPLPEDRSS